MESCRE
jgi:hypothetical protein